MSQKEILYTICLALSPNIGNVRSKKLISYCGSAEAVFKEKKTLLAKIQGVGSYAVKDLSLNAIIKTAEKELDLLNKYNIKALLFNHSDYPHRLKHCDDAPVILFTKGNANLNSQKVVAIVGTRKSTIYGNNLCEELVKQLAIPNMLIISGLAIGIDACAHKAALKYNIPTVGVVAHGLNKMYPSQHYNLAKQMLDKGALVSEFTTNTVADKENFPKRNRIIAGMSDAVIIVESALKGGALITAELSNSYNRDVFAFPGRTNDVYSQGCNRLIRNNKAALIESADDLKYIMGWDDKPSLFNNKSIQQSLTLNLSEDEKIIFNLLELNGELSIDFISLKSNMNYSKIAAILLSLELQGIIKSMPGKRYSLV